MIRQETSVTNSENHVVFLSRENDVRTRACFRLIINSEYSTSDISQSINFFTIENNQLNTGLKIAKTKEGLSNGLGINFNFFKLNGHDERPLEIVTYNPDKKTISVPVVSDDGSLTGKVTLYKFTNGFFEASK